MKEYMASLWQWFWGSVNWALDAKSTVGKIVGIAIQVAGASLGAWQFEGWGALGGLLLVGSAALFHKSRLALAKESELRKPRLELWFDADNPRCMGADRGWHWLNVGVLLRGNASASVQVLLEKIGWQPQYEGVPDNILAMIPRPLKSVDGGEVPLELSPSRLGETPYYFVKVATYGQWGGHLNYELHLKSPNQPHSMLLIPPAKRYFLELRARGGGTDSDPMALRIEGAETGAGRVFDVKVIDAFPDQLAH